MFYPILFVSTLLHSVLSIKFQSQFTTANQTTNVSAIPQCTLVDRTAMLTCFSNYFAPFPGLGTSNLRLPPFQEAYTAFDSNSVECSNFLPFASCLFDNLNCVQISNLMEIAPSLADATQYLWAISQDYLVCKKIIDLGKYTNCMTQVMNKNVGGQCEPIDVLSTDCGGVSSVESCRFNAIHSVCADMSGVCEMDKEYFTLLGSLPNKCVTNIHKDCLQINGSGSNLSMTQYSQFRCCTSSSSATLYNNDILLMCLFNIYKFIISR